MKEGSFYPVFYPPVPNVPPELPFPQLLPRPTPAFTPVTPLQTYQTSSTPVPVSGRRLQPPPTRTISFKTYDVSPKSQFAPVSRVSSPAAPYNFPDYPDPISCYPVFYPSVPNVSPKISPRFFPEPPAPIVIPPPPPLTTPDPPVFLEVGSSGVVRAYTMMRGYKVPVSVGVVLGKCSSYKQFSSTPSASLSTRARA